METKWTCIMLIGIISAFTIGTALQEFAQAPIAIEAARAGLQQCPTNGGGLAWQKECKR